MEDISRWLTEIENRPLLAYGLVLLASFLESVVLLGGVVPGSTALIFAGALAARGQLEVGTLIGLAIVGAVLGDGLSFRLGRRGGGWFEHGNRYLKPERLEAGRRFFARHGAKSVFLGRFFGPLRMIVPFVAGLSDMDGRRFLVWNVVSAVGWSVSNVMAGYLLGHAWRRFAHWTHNAGLVLAAAVAVALPLWWFWRRRAARKEKLPETTADAPTPPPPLPPSAPEAAKDPGEHDPF